MFHKVNLEYFNDVSLVNTRCIKPCNKGHKHTDAATNRFFVKIRTHLNFDLLVAKERHQVRNNARVYDHLDLFVASVSQIRQSPHRVHQDLPDHNNNTP